MKLLSYYPFITNKAGSFKERYVTLSTGVFTATLNINDETYTLRVFPNFYFETADVSILDDINDNVICNIPFNLSNNCNYLIGDKKFSKYRLYYNYNEGQFELYEIV